MEAPLETPGASDTAQKVSHGGRSALCIQKNQHLYLEEIRSAEAAQAQQDAGTPPQHWLHTQGLCEDPLPFRAPPALTFPSMMVTTSGRPPITLPRSATGKQLG